MAGRRLVPQCFKLSAAQYQPFGVAVRYCDGSSFTGDVERVEPATRLHFRGERIWIAVMEELLSLGMNKAENAVRLAGWQQYFIAIVSVLFYQWKFMWKAYVICSDIDGAHDRKDISGQPHIQTYFKEIVTLHYVAQHIKTPLFVVNAAYDSWQSVNGITDFRLKFIDALVGVRASPANGMFINSCFAHTQTVTQKIWFDPTSPVLSDTTISTAVGNWFYDRRLFRKIDCHLPPDQGHTEKKIKERQQQALTGTKLKEKERKQARTEIKSRRKSSCEKHKFRTFTKRSRRCIIIVGPNRPLANL
ncbi:hypothetical protein ACLOJK_034121 [Asimina triloba]